MRSTFSCLASLLVLFSAAGLHALADDPTAQITQTWERRDVQIGWSFTGASVTVLRGQITRDAHCIGLPVIPLLYNYPSNWDDVVLAYSNLKQMWDFTSGSPTLVEIDLGERTISTPLADLGTWGPTASQITIPIPLEEFGIPLTVEVGTYLVYNVFVEGFRHVLVNQSPEIESLTIGSASTVQIDDTFPITIHNHLTNHGLLRKSPFNNGTGASTISVPVGNTGTIECTKGTLTFSGPVTNSGWILANGGDVRLVGTLANTGAFTARAQSTIEFACPQVSVDLSVLNIDPGGGVILSGECQMGLTAGDLNNFGTILMSPAASRSVAMTFSGGDLSLRGSGKIIMTAPPDSTGSLIHAINAGERLINVNNTISGSGLISGAFTNQATVDANRPGETLSINPGSAGAINTGTMKASGGGSLLLVNGVFTNTGATITSSPGSAVVLEGATINGGTFCSGGGTLWVRSDATSVINTPLVNNAGGWLLVACDWWKDTDLLVNAGLTNESGGVVTARGHGHVYVNGGTVDNRGLIEVRGGGYGGYLTICGGEVRLTGGGTVRLDWPEYDHDPGRGGGVQPTDRLVNVDNRICGAGAIGAQQVGSQVYNALAITNQAVIDADNPTGYLEINAGCAYPIGVLNTGTMRASNGGQLLLRGGTFDNTGGRIEALAGSTVTLEDATISGGTFVNSKTGSIAIIGQANMHVLVDNGAGGTIGIWHPYDPRSPGDYAVLALVNGLSNGPGGVVAAAASGCIYAVNGTIENAGQIVLDAGPVPTRRWIVQGEVHLRGGGTVNLVQSGDVASRDLVVITGILPTDRLVNEDNTIIGSGSIGYIEVPDVPWPLVIGSMGLTNSGTIIADHCENLHNKWLRIQPGTSGVTNTGTLRAANTGTLLLQGGTFTNTGGTIEAMPDSTVDCEGATIIGGTITMHENSTLKLCQTTLTGTAAIHAPPGSTLILANATTDSAVTNQGTIRASGANNTIGGLLANAAGGRAIISDSSAATSLLLSGGLNNGAACLVSLEDRAIMQITGTSVTNAGEIRLASQTSANRLVLTGGQVRLSGGGVVSLMSNATVTHSLVGGIPTDTLVNDDNTIAGSGEIGAGFLWGNAGTIRGDRPGSWLSLDAGSGTVLNFGTMQATDGGMLLLKNGTFSNVNGTIEARADSVLGLAGVTIAGASLTCHSRGEVRVLASVNTLGEVLNNSGSLSISGNWPYATFLNLDKGLNNDGVLNLNNYSFVNLNGGNIGNSGQISLQASQIDFRNGIGARLTVAVPEVHLTGGGWLRLSGHPTGNQLTGYSGAEHLINEDNVICGAGSLGMGWLALTNHSLIDANIASQRLNVWPGAAGMVNTGTMQASNVGILKLIGGHFYNEGGTIQTLLNGGLEMDGAVVTGGTISNSSTGTITFSGATSQIGGRLVNNPGGQIMVAGAATMMWTWITGLLDNKPGGVVTVGNNGRLCLFGPEVQNAGRIDLVGGAAEGDLVVAASAVRLTGGGVVNLIYRDSINRIHGNRPTDRLINEDNTIQGDGLIGEPGMNLTNNGTIVTHGYMAIFCTDEIVNNGTVMARDGGQLTLAGASWLNNGLFKATNGGTLYVARNVAGPGRWEIDGGSTVQIHWCSVSGVGGFDLNRSGHLELDNASLTVDQLRLGQSSSLTANWGSVLTSGGNVAFEVTDPANWFWDAGSTLQITGGQKAPWGDWGQWSALEVAGEDSGYDPLGFASNFELARLVIANDAHVFLQDAIDNLHRRDHGFGQQEALYVGELVLGNGAELNLNGLHLYYQSFQGDPAGIINMPVPEPSTFVLTIALAAGLAAWMVLRRCAEIG